MDLYVFTPDKNVFNKFKKIHNTKAFNIQCYHAPEKCGLVTENLFFRVMNKECYMISNEIPANMKVLGIIVRPKLENIEVNMENFIIYNFHNPTYLKEVFGNDLYYQMFKEHGHNNLILRKLFEDYRNIHGDKIMRVKENYDAMLRSPIPFDHVILGEEEFHNYFHKGVDKVPTIKANTNIVTRHISNIPGPVRKPPINYLTMATIGLGDFIQRFERLYKLLNFAGTEFKAINNATYSYNNSSHGSGKYLTMYDFPGFEFIEKMDNIKGDQLINIQFQTLVELLLYDKWFFEDYPRDKIMYVNAGSYIMNFQNRPIVSKLFNWTNDQKIIKEIQVPFSQPNWDYVPFSANKLVVMHFRRDDYVNQLFSGRPNPRTMNTFDSLLTRLTSELSRQKIVDVDVVILSDHYNMNKLTQEMKQYKSVVFDYDEFECNRVFLKNNVSVIIRDKVLGNSEEANYNTLKYLANCDYHIGNMSCFPHIMYNVFQNRKVKEIRIEPNIRNMGDVKRIYEAL